MNDTLMVRRLLSLTVLVAAASAIGQAPVQATIVRFETSAGNIDFRLYHTATPLSTANFLNYATSDRYDGTFVHRLPQAPGGGPANFVIQGGGYRLNGSIFSAEAIATDPPVPDEPGLSNLRGTLSYAKPNIPNSATSQWFINLSDNTHLNQSPSGGFTVFGRVLGGGMAVADAISSLSVVNASVAENAPGEHFDDVPVFDLNKVLQQQDVTDADAVMVTKVRTLNYTDGDYNFDGVVDNADLAVWQADLGSSMRAEADGNGSGVVDFDDYLIWQANAVPEPGSLAHVSAFAVSMLGYRRFRISIKR